MAQQTAVEWLAEQIKSDQNQKALSASEWMQVIEQAKQMEKEQHQISFNKGKDRRSYMHDLEYGGVEYWEEYPKEFEQYYNETYNK